MRSKAALAARRLNHGDFLCSCQDKKPVVAVYSAVTSTLFRKLILRCKTLPAEISGTQRDCHPLHPAPGIQHDRCKAVSSVAVACFCWRG